MFFGILFRAVDHQWDGNLFATAGAQLDIWDHNRYYVLLTFCPIFSNKNGFNYRIF